MDNNYFVPIYNKLIEPKKKIDFITGEIIKSKYSLTPDELYIYYILYTYKNFKTNTIITNVDLLSQQVQLFSKKDKVLREDKNKVKIKEVLINLKKKNIIKFDIEEFDYTSLLDIDFNKFEGGYEPINYDIFEKTNKPKEFFILCCILALKKPISYSEFASRLGCSEKHMSKIIKEMCSDKEKTRLLNIYRGEIYKDNDGQYKQETNKYEINENKLNIVEDRKNNWRDKDAKLDYNDYVIYKTTEDRELIEIAEKRINWLKNKKIDFFDNWENKYNSYYEQNKNKNEDLKVKKYKSDIYEDDDNMLDWNEVNALKEKAKNKKENPFTNCEGSCIRDDVSIEDL